MKVHDYSAAFIKRLEMNLSPRIVSVTNKRLKNSIHMKDFTQWIQPQAISLIPIKKKKKKKH